MVLSEFVGFILEHPKCAFVENERIRFMEIANALNDEMIDLIVARFYTFSKARFYFSDFLDLLQKVFLDKAMSEAKKTRLKNFKGTEYEKEEILKSFFYRTFLKENKLEFLLRKEV